MGGWGIVSPPGCPQTCGHPFWLPCVQPLPSPPRPISLLLPSPQGSLTHFCICISHTTFLQLPWAHRLGVRVSCPHTAPTVSHVLPGQFHLWSPGALPTPRKQPKSVAWGDPVRNKETLVAAHELVQAGYELGPMCSGLWAMGLASAASGLTLSCPLLTVPLAPSPAGVTRGS